MFVAFDVFLGNYFDGHWTLGTLCLLDDSIPIAGLAIEFETRHRSNRERERGLGRRTFRRLRSFQTCTASKIHRSEHKVELNIPFDHKLEVVY